MIREKTILVVWGHFWRMLGGIAGPWIIVWHLIGSCTVWTSEFHELVFKMGCQTVAIFALPILLIVCWPRQPAAWFWFQAFYLYNALMTVNETGRRVAYVVYIVREFLNHHAG